MARITDYDLVRAKIIGNYIKIHERHPRDAILRENVDNVVNGILELMILLLEREDYLNEFKKEFKYIPKHLRR